MNKYACPNCHFVVEYTEKCNKDVNCPMCRHKFVISEKTLLVAPAPEVPAEEIPIE